MKKPMKNIRGKPSAHVNADSAQIEELALKLRQSEERYIRITGAVTDYVFTAHIENGRVVRTAHGPACIAVTGYSEEE
jgi:hypothetical protein